MAFAFGAFAVVVGPGGGVGGAGERGEVERAFEVFVAAFGWVFAADAGPGSAGDRGETGVGGEVPGGGEGAGFADFERDAGAGPDSDAGHRGQDRGERVGIEALFDLSGQLGALGQDGAQGVGQFVQHCFGCGGAGDGDGLLGEGGQQVGHELLADAWPVFDCGAGQTSAAGLAQAGRTAESGQQLEDGRMRDAGAEDAFDGGMDLG